MIRPQKKGVSIELHESYPCSKSDLFFGGWRCTPLRGAHRYLRYSPIDEASGQVDAPSQVPIKMPLVEAVCHAAVVSGHAFLIWVLKKLFQSPD